MYIKWSMKKFNVLNVNIVSLSVSMFFKLTRKAIIQLY
jgi:hypothetical protein